MLCFSGRARLPERRASKVQHLASEKEGSPLERASEACQSGVRRANTGRGTQGGEPASTRHDQQPPVCV